MTYGDKIQQITREHELIRFDNGVLIDSEEISPLLWIPISTWDSTEVAVPRTKHSLRSDSRTVVVKDRERRAGEFVQAIRDHVSLAKMRFELDPDLTGFTDNPKVPLWIVSEGRSAVAAYLAAHGWDNERIASRLDVSESTIRVNLSKFKNQ